MRIVMIPGAWTTAEAFEHLCFKLRIGGHEPHVIPLPHHEWGAKLPPEFGQLGLQDYRWHICNSLQDVEPPFALLGWSLGGLLAMQLAASTLFRAHVEKLVLLSPAPPAGISLLRPDILWRFGGVLARWRSWCRPVQLPRWYAHKLLGDKRSKHSLVPESGRVLWQVLLGSQAASLSFTRLSCPILLYSGSQDPLFSHVLMRQLANQLVHTGRPLTWCVRDDLGHDLATHPDTPFVVQDWLSGRIQSSNCTPMSE